LLATWQIWATTGLPGLDLPPARATAGIDAEDHQPELDGDQQPRAQRRGRELEQLTAAGRTEALAELSGRYTRPPSQSYDRLAE
jgi:hypothetical protein